MQTIIIAEDSKTQAEYLKFLLSNNGYNVYHGNNGKEALELLYKTDSVDLVITDLMMPEMNGYELCKAIKTNNTTKDIPVILLTSLDKTIDIIKGLAVFADNYITKPINSEYLLKRIKNILEPQDYITSQVGNKIKIHIDNEEIIFKTNPKKSIDFLLSTYDSSVEINRSLGSTQQKLKELNEELTEKGMRTSENLRSEITKRKEAMENLEIALEQAKSADRLKTCFLNNLSHEIRTPMNAIVGFSELLQDENLDYSEREGFIQYINKSAFNLLEIIENIVEAALVESKEIKLIEQECDLLELFESINKAFCNKIDCAENKKINLSYVIPDTLKNSKIILAPDKIKIILKKLLSNAFKFTNEGEIIFGVNITENKELKFFVKDTGIGIPKHKVNEIFEKFTQLEDIHTKKYPGTGIGLSTTKKLVDYLKGSIWVESKENIGSSFYFTLPYKGEINLQIETKLNNTETSHQELPNYKILITEDVETNYQLIKTVLDKKGIKHVWAKNGVQAIKKFKENKDIDLILMDIQMPIMNGIEASEKIKKLNPNIPIIALTAFVSEIMSEADVKKNFDDFLHKPILPNKIIRVIKTVMKNKQTTHSR